MMQTPFGPNKADRFNARTVDVFAAAGLPVGLDVRAATATAPAEILLYDEIGPWGITGKDFVDALAKAGAGPITVRINSPGGSVFDGLAMYNAIRNHKGGTTVVVDALAASAASYVAMAGQSVVMAERSMLMIHNGWGLFAGNQFDLTDSRALLRKIDSEMAAIYAGKTGKPADAIAAMMKAETWMTAAEAVESGFADSVQTKADPAASALADSLVAATSSELLSLRARLALAQGADVAIV